MLLFVNFCLETSDNTQQRTIRNSFSEELTCTFEYCKGIKGCIDTERRLQEPRYIRHLSILHNIILSRLSNNPPPTPKKICCISFVFPGVDYNTRESKNKKKIWKIQEGENNVYSMSTGTFRSQSSYTKVKSLKLLFLGVLIQ